MDIKSPTVLKLKAALFLAIALLSTGLLLLLIQPAISWPAIGLLMLIVWASCRAYYFCFYVMENYADPAFKYAGLLDLFLHLTGLRRKRRKPGG